MLHDIASLKLQGANFDELKELSLFYFKDKPKPKNSCCNGVLLYGRNGAGKSTIAKCFRKIAGENPTGIVQATLCNAEGKELSLTDDDKKHIFVFNEDYIDKNIKLQEDHLNTIVLLGEAADLTDKITEAEKALEKAKIEYDKQKSIYDEYNNPDNVKSPEYYRKKIWLKLKGDTNWAGRDRQITGAKKNTPVTERIYSKILKHKINKDIEILAEKFRNELEKLHTAESGNSIIRANVPNIPKYLLQYDDVKIIQALAQEIEKPTLTEREVKLLKMAQQEGFEKLEERKNVFSDNSIHECPYCMQVLNDDYKKELVKSIQKVLSKVVEEHQKELKDYLVQIEGIDLSAFKNLKNYEECTRIWKLIVDKISIYNDKLNDKISNPYVQIHIENLDVKQLVQQLCEVHRHLCEELRNYNEKAVLVEPIKDNLKMLNAEWAFLEIKDLEIQKNKQEKEFAQEKRLFCSADNTLKAAISKLEDLEAERKNVRIAVDRINACMQYIFFAKDRLSIQYGDGQYKLFSCGKPVRPCDVSVGERNIIALSYFFTNILKGKAESEAYKDEYLLVIDDPVSSFDMENHIGILSFLKYELGLFLEGNQYSCALLMTHDLMTYSDMDKIFKEMNDAYNQNHRNGYFLRWKLEQRTLSEMKIDQHQEYSELIRDVYSFALGKQDNASLMIGNEMRQILEAFATFEYKTNIEKISTDKTILNLLPSKEYVSYFKNLMYRLVLNGGSHKKDAVSFMKGYDFFSFISDEEKRRTARDILCFIYLLNKKHLLVHLEIKSHKENWERQLEKWCNEIKDQSPEL